MSGASKLLTLLVAAPLPLLTARRSSSLRLAAISFSLSSAASYRRRFYVAASGAAVQPSSGDHHNRPATSSAPQVGNSLSASPTPQAAAAPAHPLPEFLALVEHAQSVTGVDRCRSRDCRLVQGVELSEEFAKGVAACLAFAEDLPELIRVLQKKHVEEIVNNGSAWLFVDGESSARRLRSFLSSEYINVGPYETADTVDLMRFLLSHAYNVTYGSQGSYSISKDLTESAIKKLMVDLVDNSGACRPLGSTVQQHSPSQHDFSRPSGRKIEMKRGDWICRRCGFMNFARNTQCFDCNETQPKRLLSGSEWECPKCDFFNHGRNTKCLRCDCSRPEVTPATAARSGVEQLFSKPNADKSDMARKLAENDEKAERWFSKVNQLDDASDIGSLANDEDFPEIMPLRKGENRFVVSNRKTPLERRLSNSQYTDSGNVSPGMSSNSSISETLNRVLGRLPSSGSGVQSTSQSSVDQTPAFVPFPADKFGQPKNASSGSESPNAAEGWSRKVAEIDDVTNLANAIPDKDFPAAMPMRQGENRFVVSRKKDRSLTSPQYKRQSSMDRSKESGFVPFVPFPPGYFAKKDKPTDVTLGAAPVSESIPAHDPGTNRAWTASPYHGDASRSIADAQYGMNAAGYSAQLSNNWAPGQISETQNYSFAHGGTEAPRNNSDSSDGSWNRGYAGKSLEGSAVKEPNPLDMSEEAKAERWFRRAAQIKDISELANIPDEDFPSIMPMRKGVNRFVVSKRKTPLERRLTSPQYRRNLPIVSSEQEKDSFNRD